MKLSKKFGLQATQYELDFVDIDPSGDVPLFIDPYFLSIRNDPWSMDASRTIRNFFQHLITLLRNKNITKAREAFLHLNEPNETCLGFSHGHPRGNGVGPMDAIKIFDSLLQSRAVQTGVVEDIEDCRVFIPGIDKDKISDMATNIIRRHLIQYTQAQAQLWGIPLQANVPSGFVWNRKQREWVNDYTDMLIVDGKKILLVPKAVVSFAKKYTAQQYHQHFVLNFLQNEHLRLNSVLVQRRLKKDGSEKVWVTKASVRDYEAPLDKEFLAKFTEDHPEVFQNFREETAHQITSITNKELSAPELPEVIDYLINRLKAIPPGNATASDYHRTVAGILELIFYPNLSSPQVEREIDEGRKRIDITFDNGATSGFFHRLHTTYRTPSQFIMVECKNYARDVANPELDQLAGRFTPNRGKFGMILCRTIDNMDLFLARCADN